MKKIMFNLFFLPSLAFCYIVIGNAQVNEITSPEKADQLKVLDRQIINECNYEIKISAVSSQNLQKETDLFKVELKNLSDKSLSLDNIKIGSLFLSKYDSNNLENSKVSEVFASRFSIKEFFSSNIKTNVSPHKSIEVKFNLSKMQWSDYLSSSHYFIPFDEIKTGHFYLFVEFEEFRSQGVECKSIRSNQIIYPNK